MADENRYPRAFWHPTLPLKDGENPKYAHSKADEEKFAAEQWTDTFANVAKDDHHRRLYKPDGSSVVSTCAEDEVRFTAEGYSRTPVAPVEKVETVAEPPILVLKEKKRIDALEEQVREIATGQNQLAEMQQQILEELSKLNANKQQKKAS